jgi:putative membrane protein
MKKLRLILAGSTALASLALAQAPPPSAPVTPAAASPADCDRLETFLEQRHPANPGVTLEQVRTYRTSNNVQACHDALVRLDPTATQATTQEGKPGADTTIVVQQPTQALHVEQAPPQVTVQQQQPQVTVRQPQPDITVRQAAPTVTIDIPQPEIIIRMPKPEVNVAMVQPQVQVNQPPPRVQVTQPPQQPQVQVRPAEAQVKVQQQAGTAPNVQIQESSTQPTVHFERAEPKVVVNQAQGQPQIRVEKEDPKPQTAAGDRERTGAAQTPTTSEFVNKVAQSDMLEIQASQFVAPNADADTKPFADRMIRDHTETSNELKQLVQSGKVRAELPSTLDPEHQKKLDGLKKLSGRELDREYDRMQLQAHQEAVDLFSRYAQAGDNNDLKAWAAKTVLHLREHLSMAQKLDQGGITPTAGAAPSRVPGGGPAAGANSFTEGQAKSRIESQGFTNVSLLAKDDQGIWRGKATKDGKNVSVSLDFHGDVFAQ